MSTSQNMYFGIKKKTEEIKELKQQLADKQAELDKALYWEKKAAGELEKLQSELAQLKAELKAEREVVDKCFEGAIMGHLDNLKEIERLTREQQKRRGEGVSDDI